jgi:hypothetical protein
MIPFIVICGALIGAGIFILIREIRPAPPELGAGLASLDGHHQDTGPADAEGLGGLRDQLVRRLAGPGGLSIPRRDLDLLGQTPERFVTNKIGCFLLGLAVPVMPSLVAAASGLTFPFAVPVGAGLIAAIALFFAPDLSVRVDAAKRRDEFRRTLTSYLDLVALERAAGAHPNQALEAAAQVSGEWVFRRIAAVLDRARRANEQPWDGLARLGEETGVSELADIADIARIAGHEGAKVLDTLMAKTESMRRQHLSEALSESNGRTTTMVIPVALIGFGFLMLLAFPVVYKMALV